MGRPRKQLTVAEQIDRSYRTARTLILKSMKETQVGTRARLDHVRELADLDRRYRKERADRGIDATNQGRATTLRYEFTAACIEEELNQPRSARDQALIDELDEEYKDVPAAIPLDEDAGD